VGQTKDYLGRRDNQGGDKRSFIYKILSVSGSKREKDRKKGGDERQGLTQEENFTA